MLQCNYVIYSSLIYTVRIDLSFHVIIINYQVYLLFSQMIYFKAFILHICWQEANIYYLNLVLDEKRTTGQFRRFAIIILPLEASNHCNNASTRCSGKL